MAQAHTTRGNAPALPAGFSVARPGLLSPHLIRLITVALSAAGLALLLISVRPFVSVSIIQDLPETGDSLKQMVFLAAGGVCGLALLGFANPKALWSLVTPSFLMFAGLILYSVATAPDPDQAIRSLVLSLIAMLITFTIVVLPRGERDFRSALAIGALATLAVSYFGLVAMPDAAMHGFDAYEPQHAGLWRGHFPHKNIAGPIMSIVAIFGIYLYRSGMRFAGFAVAVLAFIFVLQTGSKTTTGFLPLAVGIVWLANLTGHARISIAALFVVFAAATVMAIGSAFNPTIFALSETLLGDGTYTGRTTLWEFSISMMPNHPWLGYGLNNFWQTENVLGLDVPFWAAWDYRNIIHGHQNYLDMLVQTGVIGTAILVWFLYVGPMLNYARARRIAANRKAADMFATIIVFLTLLSLLETYFLRGVDPIWVMHSLAVFGLHLLARFDIGGVNR